MIEDKIVFEKPSFSHHYEELEIPDSFVISRPLFTDERGAFSELFREKQNPLLPKFVQFNHSFSFGGVLRGMHSQVKKPQGKLVTCTFGTILDVMFDCRPHSKTFLKGYAMTLTASLNRPFQSLYIPPGCLHGFITLSQYAVVNYACTTEYISEFDGGVRWTDPNIVGLFPTDIQPIVSQKDSKLPLLDEFLKRIG